MDADAKVGEQRDLCPGDLQSDTQAAVVQTTDPHTAVRAQATGMQPPEERGAASSNEKEQQTAAPCPGGSKVELDHIKVTDSSNRNLEKSQTEDVVHLPIMNSKKISNTTPVKFTDIVAALQSNTHNVDSQKQNSSGSITTKVMSQEQHKPIMKALHMGGNTYLIVSSLPNSFQVNTILEQSTAQSTTNSTQAASLPLLTCSPKAATSSLIPQTLSSPLQPYCKKVIKSRAVPAPVKNRPVKAKRCGQVLPYPNCREICLDLNDRTRQREKRLDVKLLTNGIVKEVYSYAQKVNLAFPFAVFQTLEDNFDLCLESDLRKKFCTALSDDLVRQVRKNGWYMKTPPGLFEVYKLPEVKRTVHPPIRKYAGRRILSKDVDPSVAFRAEMERLRRLSRIKRQTSLGWQEEISRQFKTALEKMNSFLAAWVYPDRRVVQLPSEKACSERDTTPCTEMVTACQKNKLAEVDTQSEPDDSLPATHGPAREETPAVEAVVAECVVKTTMSARETVSKDIDTTDVSPQVPIDCVPHLIPLEHVKREDDSVEVTETNKAVDNLERERTIKEECADVCIKEEPDAYPISLQQIKTEIKTEPMIGGNEMPEPTQGLNIVCIKYEPEEAEPEMKVPVRDLEKHSKKLRKKKSVPKRTAENPYPLCRKISLHLGVIADESQKRKLDLKLLTNGVMLEIHDFAKDICASSKQIVMNIFAHHFDLDWQSKQSLHSDDLWLRIKQVMLKQKNLKDKTKFLKEVFTLTKEAPTEKPKQKIDKPKKMVEVLPKFQRWKEMSEKRRQDVQKNRVERAVLFATEDEKKNKKSKRHQNPHRGETAWGVHSGPQMSSLGPQRLQHVVPEENSYTIPIDEMTACGIEMEATNYITKQGPNLQAGCSSDSADHVHTLRRRIQEILMVYTQGMDQKNIFAKLSSCVGDSAAPERKLQQILADYRSDILPHMVEEYDVYTDSERVSLACVNELFSGLHLIDCLAHQANATLLVWEKMILEEKEEGDSFLRSTGITKLESRTVHLVRTVSEAVHGKGNSKDEAFTKFSTFLISKGEFDGIPLAQPQGNRLDAIGDNAAGMYSVYNDLMEFANDHMNDSSLIERVHAELQVQHVKAACRALGLISRFVLDPLWKALTLEGSAGKMTERYKVLVSRLEAWQMNGRQIVEENLRLFDDIEMPKDLVFERLTMWTDQEIFELTTQVVELLLASFHRICSKMLSSNPEYDRDVLSDELSEKVRATTKKNASFQNDVTLLGHLQKAHSGALETALEIMVMFRKCRTWEWLPSLDGRKQETVLRSLKQVKQEQEYQCDSVPVVKRMYLKRKADVAVAQNMEQTFQPGTHGQNPPAEGLVIMDWIMDC